MAFKSKNLTLLATATQAIAPVVGGTKYPCQQIIIYNTAGNADIYIGGADVSSTVYGTLLDADESLTLGPFSGEAPMNLTDVYIFGTEAQVVHIIYITH